MTMVYPTTAFVLGNNNNNKEGSRSGVVTSLSKAAGSNLGVMTVKIAVDVSEPIVAEKQLIVWLLSRHLPSSVNQSTHLKNLSLHGLLLLPPPPPLLPYDRVPICWSSMRWQWSSGCHSTPWLHAGWLSSK